MVRHERRYRLIHLQGPYRVSQTTERRLVNRNEALRQCEQSDRMDPPADPAALNRRARGQGAWLVVAGKRTAIACPRISSYRARTFTRVRRRRACRSLSSDHQT